MGAECRSPERTGMFPGCLDLKIGYAQPIDQRKIRPPDLQQTGPLSPQIKKGPLFVASQRPPTLRRNRGPTHLLFGVSRRYSGPAMPIWLCD